MGETQELTVLKHWLAPQAGWLARIRAAMTARGAHAARTIVLVPYAQLLPVAARLWLQACPDGFAPRFETTQSWSRSLAGAGAESGATDLTYDMALDVLTARTLLERAGLGDQADLLAARLVETAQQLGPLAAATPPAERPAWAARARAATGGSLESEMLKFEAALAQLAVAWAASSAYATDALFEPVALEAVDCVVVLPGLQPDPLLTALAQTWGERLSVLPLHADAPSGVIHFHPASEAQDEAQRAAACVIRHVNEGRAPVALVATDRALTRRARALLEGAGLALRDETGWKLSTSRAAAHLMGALRACARQASGDTVLAWLKSAPALDAAAVQALEAWLRRQSLREWGEGPRVPAQEGAVLAGLLGQVRQWREAMQRPRALPQWLDALRELLQQSGHWDALQNDIAGVQLLAALRLDEGANTDWQARLEAAGWARRRWSLAEFTRWVDQTLEGASFKPAHPPQEQVVILPLAQLLGRPFAAVVLPGCDEVRLNPSPEPPGFWSAAQRALLGLPARETLEAGLRAAWQQALLAPELDVLWRMADEGGEPLQASPLVQALRLDLGDGSAADPRAGRTLAAVRQARPAPSAPQLLPTRLSASAYDQLRDCPYRFFALRQLGLKEVDELEVELGKRDFGQWLHAVLKLFHEQLQATPGADATARQVLIEQAAAEATRQSALAADEFLPFQAAWPQVRDGYLAWLEEHEATGARFEAAEQSREQPLGQVTLVGRIDRIDTLADVEGGVLLLDYKTEQIGVTKDRIKAPLEDTQLPFYAALLPHDTLRAAYVNVGERDGTQTVEQKEVVMARDALIEGIVHDMRRIGEGAPLPALGEGDACEYCAARGLCRKDFWEGAA